MSKRIETLPPEETVTIPKATFDNIFRCLEEMKAEIVALRKRLENVQPKLEKVYTREEAARFCGVSVWTINNYRKRGLIHKVVQGCHTGYLERELTKVKKKKKK